jgi:predicted GNAT family acetyltransferase
MTDFSEAIRREDTETKGRYVYSGGPDLPEAELTFSKLGTTQIIIDHTEVPEAYRGQNVGVALVERAVNDMREAGLKITPLCPFAAAQFRRHPEWHDVLAR